MKLDTLLIPIFSGLCFLLTGEGTRADFAGWVDAKTDCQEISYGDDDVDDGYLFIRRYDSIIRSAHAGELYVLCLIRTLILYSRAMGR